jgi:hypothetical protein
MLRKMDVRFGMWNVSIKLGLGERGGVHGLG